MSVELAGYHVNGSPISIPVKPAHVCPAACQLTGMADGPSTGLHVTTPTPRTVCVPDMSEDIQRHFC